MKKEIFIASRGMGKTSKLIDISHETGKHILCVDRKRVKNIIQLSKKKDKDIPFPITLAEMSDKLQGGSIGHDGILVDDIDQIIQIQMRKLFQGIEIKGYSATEYDITRLL